MKEIYGKLVSAAAHDDILELSQKIEGFKAGDIDEEKFKSYRLTRGVYGQRQAGVQMFRIKIPFGKLTARQLIRIADIADTYSNGKLHITTRQNIQLHYVRLESSPEIWAELEEVGITAREACGNTVRNVTGSPRAGIDPEEPFDISPYVQVVFDFFLRNPICQEMGRKVKVAFSSSQKDTAFTYFHDFGFIAKLDEDGNRGFRVLVGGGLGAQSIVAQQAHYFLPEEELLPFLEASVRVFDRYGERSRRHKARLKFLIKEIGVRGFLELVEKERVANKAVTEKPELPDASTNLGYSSFPIQKPLNEKEYLLWKSTNVFSQKQMGFYGVNIKVPRGNITSSQARALASLAGSLAADDIRFTPNQGILYRFVRVGALPVFFNQLRELHLSEHGSGSIADIISCPGTDTCNLGVTNSYGIADRLEELLYSEYPELIENELFSIKISGCMNSCGHHMAAEFGLHGSSIKHNGLVVPAMQIVLGGGFDPFDVGLVGEKVIKLPTKRIPTALRTVLDDFIENRISEEIFNAYFQRRGKMYFYHLLKPLGDISNLQHDEYLDWGMDEPFQPQVGIGECAGVTYDVVGGIIADAAGKLEKADRFLLEQKFPEAIYESYNSFVILAKALLLAEDVQCNTQMGIIRNFDDHFGSNPDFATYSPFEEQVLRINKNVADGPFAKSYLGDARSFYTSVQVNRNVGLRDNPVEKTVVENYYKA